MSALVGRLVRNGRLDGDELARIGECVPLRELMGIAEAQTIEGFGRTVSYSRKVFIPLTQLCRDVCHYCTFAQTPRRLGSAYLSEDQVLEIARAGAAAECREALFTLGDKPELRYRLARKALGQLGYSSTLGYLEAMARLVHRETGLLPHLNPGVMDREELSRLRSVSVSMGLMLESTADRLCDRGGPHYGSPDKLPARRLQTLRWGGELSIPFTSGLLIGIGETRAERVAALLALRDLHERFGHLQEIIVQNFRAKRGTKMEAAPEPAVEDLQWTIAMARLTFGPEMSLQAPPNLQPSALRALLSAGINDWGGVSPVTPDHVNPEAPWPRVELLARETLCHGAVLTERLAISPRHARLAGRWVDAALAPDVRRDTDSEGYRRKDTWYAGGRQPPPATGAVAQRLTSADLDPIFKRANAGLELTERDIVRLFATRGAEVGSVARAADNLRLRSVGNTVTYVVNRNINYTNICVYHCGFCAFSKGRGTRTLRGAAYDLELKEISARTRAAAAAGATEVCLQGGIHPRFTGETYLNIVAAVKEAVPNIHIHAFSPLEVLHGATTLGLPLREYLTRLKLAGLSTLPGTAAEILDDNVRKIICPDKLSTREWLEVVGTAHRIGLRTTATIMFGHVEQPIHWARHLLALRRLQAETGGITEFVPLPYVHMEAPLWRKGLSRSGPTFREAILMHAVARLALHPLIPNIQTSWVKMGAEGAAACLDAGANDLGGTLMNESITRAAGGVHGQEFDAMRMQTLARSLGRPARQRTTLYGHLIAGRRDEIECAHSVAGRVSVGAPDF